MHTCMGARVCTHTHTTFALPIFAISIAEPSGIPQASASKLGARGRNCHQLPKRGQSGPSHAPESQPQTQHCTGNTHLPPCSQLSAQLSTATCYQDVLRDCSVCEWDVFLFHTFLISWCFPLNISRNTNRVLREAFKLLAL